MTGRERQEEEEQETDEDIQSDGRYISGSPATDKFRCQESGFKG
jgi:hypothetical protein